MNQFVHVLCAATMLIAGSADAGTWRHDEPEPALPNEVHPSVGVLWGRNHLCSGTLIGDQWVLSAAHCLDRGKASHYTFDVGGASYAGDRKFVHPDWNGYLPAGNDLALLQLETAVDGGSAIKSELYTNEDEDNAAAATIVGFGRGGTGVTGSDQPINFSNPQKRAGDNKIDGFGELLLGAGWSINVLLLDFDNPQGLVPDDGNNFGGAYAIGDEFSTAPGDSGGPLFIGDKVAGIHSFIYAPLDEFGNSDYDDAFGETRVSQYVPWINGVMDGTGEDDPKGGKRGGKGRGKPSLALHPMLGLSTLTAPVPEPSGALLLVFSIIAMAGSRKRRG